MRTFVNCDLVTVLKLCFRYHQGFEESVNRTGLMFKKKAEKIRRTTKERKANKKKGTKVERRRECKREKKIYQKEKGARK